MPEINVDFDFEDHPKTLALCGDLGDWASIIPVRLWIFAGRFHASTGVITSQSAKFLEQKLKWRGEKGKLIAALVEHGFLEPTESGYVVHDFLRRNGHIHKFSKRGKTAANSRWAGDKGDAKGTPKQCKDDAQALLGHELSNALADEAKRSEANDAGEPPKLRWAFREWLHHLGRAPTKADDDRFLDELNRQGYTDSELCEAIKDPAREREQMPWDFTKWLKTRTPKNSRTKEQHAAKAAKEVESIERKVS